MTSSTTVNRIDSSFSGKSSGAAPRPVAKDGASSAKPTGPEDLSVKDSEHLGASRGVALALEASVATADAARIETLKAAIQDGTYAVDIDALANRLVDDAFDGPK